MTESVCPLLIWSHLLPCMYAVSGVMLPTVSAIRRRKKQGWKEVALYPRLARRERNRSTNCCSGTSLLLDSITLHLRAGASLFIRGLRMCADSTCPLNSLLPYRLCPAGRGGAEKKTTTISSFRSYSEFTCAQPMDPDYLACFAWLALW